LANANAVVTIELEKKLRNSPNGGQWHAIEIEMTSPSITARVKQAHNPTGISVNRCVRS
jgi:hypothetical protein